jgi:peptide/nickel transport system substrate-binding protein
VAYRGGLWMRVMPQFVNPDPPVVADVRFRRAMLHAIDRQQMMDSLAGGLGAIPHTFVEPSAQEYPDIEESVVRYAYDPRKAAELIEALGYRRAGDGMFRDAASGKLAVEFQTTAQNPAHPKGLAIVADSWEQVGVTVDQVVIPIQRSQDAEYRATFPAFELSLGSIDTTSRGVQRFHSGSTPLPENRFQNRGNDARYMNRELDLLIERYVTTIPRPERVRMLAQMVQHQSEQVTFLGIFWSLSPTMIASRLEHVTAGNTAAAIRSTEAWNAQEWDVR